MRRTTRTAMQANIKLDPLLAALFDLPRNIRVSSNNNKSTIDGPARGRVPGGRRPTIPRNNSSTSGSSVSRSRVTSPGRNDFLIPRPKTPGQDDDDVETDNTSLLHGETISLTDEEFSDAAAHLPPSVQRKSSMTQTQFTVAISAEPQMLHGENLPLTDEDISDAAVVRFSQDDRPTASHKKNAASPFSSSESLTNNDGINNFQREFVLQPTENLNLIPFKPPPLKAELGDDGSDEASASAKNSPKKKKKKRPTLKSLKKLVGGKVGSKSRLSRSSLFSMASSQEDDDSAMSTPTSRSTDVSSKCDKESSFVRGDLSSILSQNIEESKISYDQIAALQTKISRIRSSIHSLEKDLIATRNELAVAYQHLQTATFELSELQRGALEAEVGLCKLAQQQGMPIGMSSCMRVPHIHCPEVDGCDIDLTTKEGRSSHSSSSSSQYFLTPTSSMAESGDDSDFHTFYSPQSRTSSYDSLTLVGDTTPPFIGDNASARSKNADKDRTPLTKNARRRKFESGVLTSVVSSQIVDLSSKEADLIDTPSTAASTHEETVHSEGEDLLMPEIEKNDNDLPPPESRRVTFSRQSSFIRTHDLTFNGKLFAPLHGQGVNEVIDALFERGFEIAMDESDRWSPVRDTDKILSKRAKKLKNGAYDSEGPMGQWPNAASGSDVLVWHSKYPHDGHGSEYPMVKARGLIPTSARDVVGLLLDSDRVKLYNKMSLGRIDEHFFSTGIDNLIKCPMTGLHGEAKICRSKSQPPIVRKPVELRVLFHARRLCSNETSETAGTRYVTICRSVWEREDGTADSEDKSSTRCEMLLGVNLIRDLDSPQASNGSTWCEITTITHAVSPGIPLSIGKRIGLAAAGNYIRDIRSVFENK